MSLCVFQYDFFIGAIVVVMVWGLDLQLSVQSVPITTKVVSLNPVHGEVYSIQHYVISFSVTCDRTVRFSPGTPVSFTNKTVRHDITEILLKVALNTINQPTNHFLIYMLISCKSVLIINALKYYSLHFKTAIDQSIHQGKLV